MNDCHSGACGGHQSGYATAQNILRASYFWPTIFKYCITVVRSCHACQIFDCKNRIPPAPLHLVVVVGPFAKWGIDFMKCNPTSAGGHGYTIIAVDYFTKWAEAMPTLNNSKRYNYSFLFQSCSLKFQCSTSYIHRSWITFLQSHDGRIGYQIRIVPRKFYSVLSAS